MWYWHFLACLLHIPPRPSSHANKPCLLTLVLLANPKHVVCPARNAGVLAEKLAAAEARAERAEAEAAVSAAAARRAAAAEAELARWAAALSVAGLPAPTTHGAESAPGGAPAALGDAQENVPPRSAAAGAAPPAGGPRADLAGGQEGPSRGNPSALVRMVGELQSDAAAARERLGAARAEARELKGAGARMTLLFTSLESDRQMQEKGVDCMTAKGHVIEYDA